VLVGTGLSRYADLPSPDTPQPPLRADLAAAMKQRLYRRSSENDPTDPLRHAEEYRTNFGQSALDEFNVCGSLLAAGGITSAVAEPALVLELAGGGLITLNP
jgi:hypothetical protein